MRKLAWKTLPVCLALLLSFSGTAGAHVVVYPRETTQGAFEKFTVRVPSEIEDARTVAVEIDIPAEVNITRVEPKPGWSHELTEDASTGKVTRVKWTAEGEGLADTEFAEFSMQGRVGDEAVSLVWKAYQTYDDGTVVEWVGAEGSAEPASVTAVKAPEADGGAAETSAPFPWTAGVSIAALLASLAALAVSLRKGQKRT